MGSWSPPPVFYTGLAFLLIAPLVRHFAPSLLLSSPFSSNSVLPFGIRDSCSLLLAILLYVCLFCSVLTITRKITKTFVKSTISHRSARLSLASPSTHARLCAKHVLMLLQTSLAYSWHYELTCGNTSPLWIFAFKGIFTLLKLADTRFYSMGFMMIQCVFAGCVMLVFGPVFAPAVAAIIPGKEVLPYSPVETRWPLSPEATTCSEDVSLWSLNLWKCPFGFYYRSPSSVEAFGSPQATGKQSSASCTSGSLSTSFPQLARTNFQLSVHLPSHIGVAHATQTQVYTHCGLSEVMVYPILLRHHYYTSYTYSFLLYPMPSPTPCGPI